MMNVTTALEMCWNSNSYSVVVAVVSVACIAADGEYCPEFIKSAKNEILDIFAPTSYS